MAYEGPIYGVTGNVLQSDVDYFKVYAYTLFLYEYIYPDVKKFKYMLILFAEIVN
jgi:hypothetical protein